MPPNTACLLTMSSNPADHQAFSPPHPDGVTAEIIPSRISVTRGAVLTNLGDKMIGKRRPNGTIVIMPNADAMNFSDEMMVLFSIANDLTIFRMM